MHKDPAEAGSEAIPGVSPCVFIVHDDVRIGQALCRCPVVSSVEIFSGCVR